MIGEIFLEAYEQLTAPPRGKKILLISQQLDNFIKDLSTTNLSDLFEDGVSKHVYYVSGFLCRAGEKEADRRSKDKNSIGFAVGQCIKEVSAHFVSKTSPSEIDDVKQSLPEGTTSLVDKHSIFGGLKYPDRQFYSLIAKVEYCYSNLATPNNFRTYGGIVMSYICNEIAEDESLVSHFKSLVHEEQYDDKTIMLAFKYYIKVFGNLRVKDLARKLNAKLHKSTTAALRPSLATKGESKTKRNKAKSKSKVTKPTRVEEEEVELSEEEMHMALIDIADEEIEYESDD